MTIPILTRIKINLKYILSKFMIVSTTVFGLLSIAQIFFDWNTFGIDECNVKAKFIILAVAVILCIIVALVWGLLSSKVVTILSADDVKIIVKYDDLMDIAFPKKPQPERIVVIAVNCCFDTIVNDVIISKRSVHGQFINHYIHSESDLHDLDDKIDKNLSENTTSFTELSNKEKKAGKLKRYPLGSIAKIEGSNGVTFFLLALTQFDNNCNAHCSKQQYFDSLIKLFEYYDKNGQGKELYLYPMGTGMSRTGISKEEALDSIILLTKINKKYLKNKTTIVVDKRCKNEISITNL